jgi:hypothetical protein
VPPPSAPPAQTEEQLRAARAKAQEARTVRAEVKAELRDGATTFEQVLERAAGDEHVNRLKVLALLESVPGLGKVKSRRLMGEIGIAESRRVRGLGPEQRKALLAALADRTR